MRKHWLLFGTALWLLAGMGKNATAQQIPEAIDALLPAWAQLSNGARPDTLSSNYRLDFAIPDAPAFALLDESPSDILRPSSVKEFAVALSSFIDTATGGFDIPQALALEFSPGLLIGGNDLSLREYQETPFLYRLRVSAGTRRLSGQEAPSQIAFGIRTSFIDESDLRTDKAFIAAVTGITSKMVQAVMLAPPPPPTNGSGAVVLQPSNPTLDSLNQALQQIITNAQADQRWNRRSLDFALAALFSSPDSAVKGLQTSEISAWLTWAEGFGTWGQLLLGGKAGMQRGISSDSLQDSASSGGEMDFAATLSSRLYMGVNNYKAFVELQYATTKATNTLLINGGGEAMLRSGIWVSFGGGVERNLDAGVWNVISKFSLKLGLPFLE